MKEIKQLIEKLQPHDAVFKSSLKYVAVAKKFFEIHLPSNVLDLIDLETLLLCSESFITNSLQKYDSDSNKTIIMQHKLINLLEYVQKNIYIKDFFVNNKQLQILLENTSIAEYRQAVLKYLYVCANISDKQAFYKQLVIYAKTIGLTGEKFMGTLAEYWFEDGLRKGESKTIKAMAKKMLGAKIDFKIVAKLTGLKSAELKSYIT